MALLPKAQKEAQSVIDVAVGTSRLPLWTDRPSLKYMDAVPRETLRWYSILPPCKMSIILIQPSVVCEDYYIPKGHTFSAVFPAYLTRTQEPLRCRTSGAPRVAFLWLTPAWGDDS